MRLRILDREIDVYLFTIIFQIPEADVCPITKDIAEGESVELISEKSALSRAFHLKYRGLTSCIFALV